MEDTLESEQLAKPKSSTVVMPVVEEKTVEEKSEAKEVEKEE